jgi:hypothetical protein
MPTEVTGIAEVSAALSALVRNTADAMALAALSAFEEEIAPYPPATAANDPGAGWYYIRGKGAFYQSRRTGRTRQVASSQTLGRRWKIVKLGTGMAELVNEADYAGAVHGTMLRRQAAPMARIGWRDTRTSVDAVIRRGELDAVMARVLRRLVREVGL